MKKLFAVSILSFLLVIPMYVMAGGKSGDRDKQRDEWRKKKHKTIPIDGGLSLFLLAGGVAGAAALRKKKKEA